MEAGGEDDEYYHEVPSFAATTDSLDKEEKKKIKEAKEVLKEKIR
jgi:hypothetical protein